MQGVGNSSVRLGSSNLPCNPPIGADHSQRNLGCGHINILFEIAPTRKNLSDVVFCLDLTLVDHDMDHTSVVYSPSQLRISICRTKEQL